MNEKVNRTYRPSKKLIETGCYGYYDFEIWEGRKGFTYRIVNSLESTESFETAQEAAFAAIGHIDLLENGVTP